MDKGPSRLEGSPIASQPTPVSRPPPSQKKKNFGHSHHEVVQFKIFDDRRKTATFNPGDRERGGPAWSQELIIQSMILVGPFRLVIFYDSTETNFL